MRRGIHAADHSIYICMHCKATLGVVEPILFKNVVYHTLKSAKMLENSLGRKFGLDFVHSIQST